MTSDLTITLSGPDGTPPTRLDDWARQLGADLRGAGKFEVGPAQADITAEGTKSGVLQQIGVLAVSGVFSAASLHVIGNVLVAFIRRSHAGSITVQRGDRSVEITGVSHRDAKELANELDTLLGDKNGESD